MINFEYLEYSIYSGKIFYYSGVEQSQQKLGSKMKT